MTAALTNEQIDVLLNTGLHNESTVHNIIQQLSQISSDLIPDHLNHEFFSVIFFPRLCQVLKQWSDKKRTNIDSNVLRHASNLIFHMSFSMKNQLENNKELLHTIDICLNNISSFGFYITNSNEKENVDLASFDRIVQAYGNIKCQDLMESVTCCTTSRFYEDALFNIRGAPLNTIEHFLLVTCPNYVLDCDEEQGKYAQLIFDLMHSQYAKFFGYPYGDINHMIENYTQCLLLPLRLVAFGIRTLDFNEQQCFKNVSIKILEHGLSDSDFNEKNFTWQHLVYSSLKILLEIGHSSPQLFIELRDNLTSCKRLLHTLLKLSDDQNNEIVQLQAFEMISSLLPEEEFCATIDIHKFVRLFMKKFIAAVDHGTNDNGEYNTSAEELLYGLKNMIECTSIREQLIEAQSLPYLIKYAMKTPNNELPLQIIYTLVFSVKCKEEFKKNDFKAFLNYVKGLYLSNKKEVRQAAHGISWKLTGETNFIEAIENQEKKVQQKPPDSQVEPSETNSEINKPINVAADKYHVMISYSWANKAICRQIHQRFLNDGYRVWIDENEMHGSIIERMAEAIEKSSIILMCMSSDYKKSANCQAEAEYAFNRKKAIVPIKVENQYRPDGWLGFIVGNKIYIEFADIEFEKAYAMLIRELQCHGFEKHEEPSPFLPELKSNEPSSQINNPSLKKIDGWTENNIIEFLVDNNLANLLPIFEGINGQGLVELYQVYKTSPNELYQMFSKHDSKPSLGIFFKFIGSLKKIINESEQV